ncbi:hypothetical protein MYU51_005837 [Penicillium brevicompactum]|uniref:uncharacterized protein n=1 Tax=Penicillium brevicompactum TaxID=5074 RepID=UPI002541FEC1|nr:uncharacterized protein N7506_004755 [Penicillium brevicompactum]KAJ5336733.1 hypothetical protein N7506_004755 [Penicillium brevicompactum]
MAVSSLWPRISTIISGVLLSSWTLIALGFTALNLLNRNRTFIGTAASVSLLTYLAARLLVLSQKGALPHDSLALFLTTSHLRSREEAFTTLLFACAWLYELLSQAVVMSILTVLGGTLAAAIYNDTFEETNAMHFSDSDRDHTALAEIDEFKAQSGFDPLVVLRVIPPKALIYLVVLLWVNFAALGLYVLRLAWRSAKVVLGSPPRRVILKNGVLTPR